MKIIRYEIRWNYRRSFYEGGDCFEYVPFDTKGEAIEYINENQDICKSDNDCKCGLYKVVLYPNYESTELLIEL